MVIGMSSKTTTRKKRQRKLSRASKIQSLENRQLMAGDIDLFSSGFVDVDGTNESDVIQIRQVNSSRISIAIQDSQGSVRKDDDGNDLFRVFNKSAVNRIRVDALNGNDRIENQTDIRSLIFAGFGDDTVASGKGNDFVDAGSGNDVVYGGEGNDRIAGGFGNDKIFGQNGDDAIFGDSGTDYLYGGNGEDQIHGGSSRDYLYGENGDDELFGGFSNDYLFGGNGDDNLKGGSGSDRLYGQNGNDNLYGESGNDRLYGQNDDDGLFGGSGTDRLYAGTGQDRVLQQEGSADFVYHASSDDAIVWFKDTPQRTVNLRAIGQATYAAGSWTESEVVLVDKALEMAHDATGNTKLLKNYYGGALVFYRQGAWMNTGNGNVGRWVNGWNTPTDGAITMTEQGMSNSTKRMHQTVLHEIGHNFDDAHENNLIGNFRSLSGWTQKGITKRWVWGKGWISIFNDTGLDNKDSWWHAPGKKNFVREYGRTNPFEDFATSFAAYFLEDDYAGSRANGNTLSGPDAAPLKMSYMSTFIASMS